ncbi:MAG TPA: FoF1 ATP synthase subunit a [Patescibacteria group bacterium]|jgi:F-type H+-transporting ATPase subunit a|nr:FoF1 ATP synthase subunit a [Patescibacteria group bacterium]
MLALPPLAAEPIFYVSSFPVTNTLINSTLTMLGFVLFAFLVNKAVKKYQSQAPRGILNFFERILELLYQYFDTVTQSRKKTIQFLPLVGTLFLFILVSNWIGLLPGIGSIGRYLVHEGHVELIPLFRPANTDLNMTVAMAIIAVVVSHFLGIAVIGFFKYANKFIKLGDLWHGFKSGKPINILTAVIEFFVGLLEIISEVAKLLSLSLRLFGNVFAGEVLLTVLAGILPVFLPLPFMALEIIVGVVQATVFSMLTLVYLTIATTPIVSHDKAHPEDLEPTPTV